MPDLTAFYWNQLFPAANPAAREDFAMVWDGSRVFLFGGISTTTGGSFTYYGDTWVYTAGNWTQLTPATNPSARFGHRMVWDGSRVLMFGGVGSLGTPLAETWEFVGGNWNQLSPAASPPARFDHGMVWDGSRAVIYGGIGTGVNAVNDTWKFQAGTWTDLAPANSPDTANPAVGGPGRYAPGMVWDGSRVLLHGGITGNVYPSDPYFESGGPTWEFTAGDWDQPGPADEMSERHYHQLAFDEDAEILSFGGDVTSVGSVGRNYVADTWQFASSTWTELPQSIAPTRRAQNGLVWDGTRFLMFGGLGKNASFQPINFGDTWEFTPGEQPETAAISHTFGLG